MKTFNIRSIRFYLVLSFALIICLSFTIIYINTNKHKSNVISPLSQGMKSLGKQMADTNISLDLDGDGSEEVLLYTQQGQLFINDIEYTDHLKQLGKSKPLRDCFYIMDMDTSDSYKEIGISSYGRSDDLITLFYYYKEHKLLPMGELEGFPENEDGMRSITKKSEGILNAPIRLSILQTWWGNQTYELNEEHQISPIPHDYYEPTTSYTSSLIQPIPFYNEPDLAADTLEISMQDISFTLTDNKKWCKINTNNNVEGWFYIDNGLINGTFEPLEIFIDLALYD